jgi:hypothetical protein
MFISHMKKKTNLFILVDQSYYLYTITHLNNRNPQDCRYHIIQED